MACKFITCHVCPFCSVSDNAAKSFAGEAIWPVRFPGTPPSNQQPPFHKPPQLECVRMDSVLINHSYSSQPVHKHTLTQSKTCRRLWPNTQLLECAVLHSRVLREVITQKEAFSLWKRAESSCFYLRNLRVRVYLLHCFPYASIYTDAVGFLFFFPQLTHRGLSSAKNSVVS